MGGAPWRMRNIWTNNRFLSVGGEGRESVG